MLPIVPVVLALLVEPVHKVAKYNYPWEQVEKINDSKVFWLFMRANVKQLVPYFNNPWGKM